MRPSWDQHFMKIAHLTAEMGTCARRQVGCVLVDDRNVILATGFNGPPPKWDHCRGTKEEGAVPCPGAHAPSGTGLDECYAGHAEINALLHTSDVTRIQTCYTTSSPCINCIKALLVTSCLRIVFSDEYPHPPSRVLWTRRPYANSRAHRTWERFDGKKTILIDSSEANDSATISGTAPGI